MIAALPFMQALAEMQTCRQHSWPGTPRYIKSKDCITVENEQGALMFTIYLSKCFRLVQ